MHPEKYTPRKIILLCIGFIAISLAALGVLMPVLPAVPFLVVALWAFARSDARMHSWLIQIPLFRHVMKHAIHFEKHRALTRNIKIIAQIGSWSSFLFLLSIRANMIIVAIALAGAIICSLVMWLIPTVSHRDIKDDSH